MPYIELDVLNNAAAPVLGIDLGTTNSLVAVFRGDRPQVLRPDGKSGRIPSVLYFAPNGKVDIGERARERALVDPKDTIFSVKRFMGRGLKDVEEDLKSIPFPATETEHGLIEFNIHGRRYTPQELSAMVLRRVHQAACELIEGPQPSQCVITVPAYFDDAQRQATRDAARIAGLEVLRVVNEPTAASLAYGLDQRSAGNIVVYDLGGGTFDVSVLSIEEGVFRVLSTSGDTHLGGDDFDRSLVDLALEELGATVSSDILDDPSLQQGLRLAGEHAKQELSRSLETNFHLSIPQANTNYHRQVTRAEFEERTRPLVDRTFDACRRALADANLTPEQIDEVVLVGGSTRIPAVRQRVEAFFGRKPHLEIDPDEVVALGAAVQAHVLAGGTRDILLMDVTPLSLGMETMGGAVSKIVDRNSPIPHQATEVFTTYADNQTGIDFHIVQGERELAQDCRSLGRFKLSGIPPMPAGLARVAVRFSLDANGLLNVRATEESTGTSASIDVQPAHGLTDDQVETMLEESYSHAQEDFDARRVADLKTEMGIMLRATEANIDAAEGLLDAETVEDIHDAVAESKAASETLDLDRVQKARDELERATLPLASVLMNRVAHSSLAGKSLRDV